MGEESQFHSAALRSRVSAAQSTAVDAEEKDDDDPNAEANEDDQFYHNTDERAGQKLSTT